MKYLKFLLFLVVISPLNNCDRDFQKPKTVSEKAIWVGGTDGGVWIESSIKSDSSAVLKIYSHNGIVLKNSEYVLAELCEDVNLSNEILSNKMSAFDGANVILNISVNDRFCTLREISN